MVEPWLQNLWSWVGIPSMHECFCMFIQSKLRDCVIILMYNCEIGLGNRSKKLKFKMMSTKEHLEWANLFMYNLVFLLYNTVPICIARVWVLKTLLQYILATWETSCVQSIWFVVLINFIPFKPNSPTMVNFMKKMIPPNFWFLNYHSTFPIHQGINFLTQNGTVRVRHWNSIRWELHFFLVH